MKHLSLFIFILLIIGCSKDDESQPAIRTTFYLMQAYNVVNSGTLEFQSTLTIPEGHSYISHGLVWSTTNAAPTMDDQFTDLGPVSTSGEITHTIESLDHEKTYHVRGYLKDAGGEIVYGNRVRASTAWQMTDGYLYSGGSRDGIAMVINDLAYVGLGSSSGHIIGGRADFWSFDPATKAWTKLKDFPGGDREEAFSFVLNGKGYIGGGLYLSSESSHHPEQLSDLWEYDPATDLWTQKNDLPGYVHRIAFVLDGQAYLFDKSRFLRYNPAEDNWTDLSFPFAERYLTTSFVMDNKAYLVGGVGINIALNEVVEYDPGSNTWTQKGRFPVKLVEAVSFSHDGHIYIGTGSSNLQFTELISDIWKYDPELDQWKKVAGTPISRQGGLAFTVDGQAFIGNGMNEFSETLNDWWEYIPDEN